MQYVFVNKYGEPQYFVTSAVSGEYIAGTPYGEVICYPKPDHLSESDLMNEYVYKEGNWVNRPSRPESGFYTWDASLFNWRLDVSRSVEHSLSAIEKTRIAQTYAPIMYEDILLDGDLTAQTNIQAKLEEIRARIELNSPMPAEQMVWRDTNNQLHTWTDQQAYYHWLLGYAIALSVRGTQCYQVAWALKERLHAYVQAQDEDALLNFTV